MKIDRIISVEKFNFVVVVPPGIPCMKVTYRAKNVATLQSFVVAVWSRRGSWVRALNELCVSHKIARDLADFGWVHSALVRVILADSLESCGRKRVSVRERNKIMKKKN